MQRLDSSFANIDLTAIDILQEFPNVKLPEIFEALRLGSLAKYGRTYKLTTQEVVLWIREYLKTKKSNLL
jgi:hypothetical protein